MCSAGARAAHARIELCITEDDNVLFEPGEVTSWNGRTEAGYSIEGVALDHEGIPLDAWLVQITQDADDTLDGYWT